MRRPVISFHCTPVFFVLLLSPYRGSLYPLGASHMFKSRHCVESLETRRLLSAAHPPLLTGIVFYGSDTASFEDTLQIIVTSESKSGALHGDLTTSAGGMSFTGSVNAKGAFTLHTHSARLTISATGKATLTSISGKLTYTIAKHGSSHGLFNVIG